MIKKHINMYEALLRGSKYNSVKGQKGLYESSGYHICTLSPEYLVVPHKFSDGYRYVIFYEIPEKIEISYDYDEGSYGEYAAFNEFNGVENDKEIRSEIKEAIKNLSENVIITEIVEKPLTDIREFTKSDHESFADKLIYSLQEFNLEDLKDPENQKKIGLSGLDEILDDRTITDISNNAIKLCWDMAENTFDHDQDDIDFDEYEDWNI